MINSDVSTMADFVDVEESDLFGKTKPFWEWIRDYKKKGYHTYRREILSPCQNRVIVYDHALDKKREMVMMGSNSFLGITTHPYIIEECSKSIREYGTGAGSAPLLSGTYKIHKELEEELADFVGCEDSIVFPSGYSTCVGAISSMLRKDDVAIIDRLNHASLIDGCKLSGSKFVTYKHNNMKSLETALKTCSHKYKGELIIADAVFSMDGDLADIPGINKLAEKYGARVMIDDAHGIGVMGREGRGTVNHFGLDGKVDIIIGTFSKALGSVGGFVGAGKEVVNYIRYFSRSYFFSASPPPVVIAAVKAALKIIKSEPELLQKLWNNTHYMHKNLKSIGFNIGETVTPIIPVIIGNDLTLKKMGKEIHERGIFTNPIPYPAVAKNNTRFRLTVMATHTKEDMDMTLEVLEAVGRKYNILKKKPVGIS